MCLELSEELIEKKLNYCHQLLKLADVIEPGLSQLRGHLLFELQSVMEHKAKRAFKHDSAEFKVCKKFIVVKLVTVDIDFLCFVYQEFIKDAAGHLMASAEILRYETHWPEILEKRRLVFDRILKEM
jgi:hypothetical protein